MTNLGDAIARRLSDNAAPAKPFEADDALEEWGRKLDVLRENNSDQYNAPGLSRIKQSVATYRARKANHEQETHR